MILLRTLTANPVLSRRRAFYSSWSTVWDCRTSHENPANHVVRGVRGRWDKRQRRMSGYGISLANPTHIPDRRAECFSDPVELTRGNHNEQRRKRYTGLSRCQSVSNSRGEPERALHWQQQSKLLKVFREPYRREGPSCRRGNIPFFKHPF